MSLVKEFEVALQPYPEDSPKFQALLAGVRTQIEDEFARVGSTAPPDLDQRITEFFRSPVGQSWIPRAVVTPSQKADLLDGQPLQGCQTVLGPPLLDPALTVALVQIFMSEETTEQSDQSGMADEVFGFWGRLEMTWLAFREALRGAWNLTETTAEDLRTCYNAYCGDDIARSRAQEGIWRPASLRRRWRWFWQRFELLRRAYGGTPR